MHRNYDEPIFIDPVRKSNPLDKNGEMKEKIKALCDDQSFAVLATVGGDQPYTSIVSFVLMDDYISLIFATPRNTRKYSFLSQNAKVSLLVDNRSLQPDSINRINALTIIGEVSEIDKENHSSFLNAYLKKHPYLNHFIYSDSTALLKVDVKQFIMVGKFQEVMQWVPQGN